MSDRLPGRPLPSGFTPLSEAKQQEFRRQRAAMVRRLAPIIREMDECRGRAAASARTAFIG